MNLRVLAIALTCAVLVFAGLAFLLSRRAPPVEGGSPVAAVPASASRDRAEKSDAVRPEAVERRGAAARPAPASPSAAAAPELGTLHILSDVPGAQVFIDRQFVGRTPVTAGNVTPGTHQLNVNAEGFDGVAQTIDVEPGPRDIEVRLREVRLDASVAVVHKHRLGSCTGRLIASAAGMRYETSNTEDAFSAALADLETFQVDYVEKNLRVRLRGGRQFNFTDPEGDSDRLFVFHRDVEKARERLAKGDTPARD